MAAPTLTTMMANVRLYIQDLDTTVSSSFTDAQLTTFINSALMWWYENNEKRVKSVVAIAALTETYEQDGDATFLYPEILGMGLDYSGNPGLTPLVRIGWNEMRMRQNRYNTTGGPTHYAALKYGAAAVSAAAQNKWKFAFGPSIPTTATYSATAIVRDYPVALSAGADICDVGDFEGKCIEIIAAILAAPRMGRPELAEDLMGLLPKLIQDKLQTHRVHDEAVA